ncbi:hypothetical protein AZ66_26620 [Paenibacillus sp. E194]|uniref:hypothetical protein n=1 Tax=Paenibacillus sp. E194 TaxID=1458845 RepID=UPI0005CA244A|nr:hypothetical protein [Paenibacillus sp. E194]KJB85121.1 hypothetical protein AZ66_26620 [Paenibacillus sp. E194]
MVIQIVMCDRIKFEENHHVLGKIINAIRVPVFPYVIKLSLLLKISGLPAGEDVLTELKVVNELGEELSSPGTFVHRNYRDSKQVPGVDQNFDFTLLVEREENIFFECYINGEMKNWYPVNISLGELELSEIDN